VSQSRGRGAQAQTVVVYVRGFSQKVELRCNAVGVKSDESQGDGFGDSAQVD
jgi:hypothetical protein